MKRKLKVDLHELDVALNWGMSETEYYLDLETGKVVSIDDDTRWTLRGLVEEVEAEKGSFLAVFEKMLEQREDVPEWQKEVVLDPVRVDYDQGNRYLPIERDEPYQGYSDMDDFIGTLDDDQLRAAVACDPQARRVPALQGPRRPAPRLGGKAVRVPGRSG